MESIHEVHLQCGSDVGIGDTVAHYTIHLQHTEVKADSSEGQTSRYNVLR